MLLTANSTQFRYLAVLRLRIEPVRDLYEERVIRVRVEDIPQIPPKAELVVCCTIELPSLLPDEEHRRARSPLPPQDRVRPELLEAESAGIASVLLEAGVIVISTRIRELPPVRVLTCGDERLRVELQRQVRCRCVVDA